MLNLNLGIFGWLIGWMTKSITLSFFGIGLGPSKQEKNQFNALNAENVFATGHGEGDISTAEGFMRDILSGDPTKVARALAPQISQAQQRAQQQKNTNAQFGTRSGGTAATNANIDASTRGDITNLVGGLTDSTAKDLASLGTNLFGAGQAGTEAAFGESKVLHDQNAAKWNDIFKSIEDSASAAAGFPGVSSSVSQGINAVGSVFG